MRARFFFWFLLLIFTAVATGGCGGTGRQSFSEFHKKEASFSKRAKSAYKAGRYDRALIFYREALQASRAVEDINLTAINLINIANIYRLKGENDNAMRTVDEILEARYVQYPPARLSEAALIKALLFRDAQNYFQAREMANRAMEFCRQAQCGQEGRIYNVKARIAFLEKNLGESVTLARLGLKINRARKDQQETANSLRLIADVKTEEAEYDQARLLYEETLKLDKSLGLSKKIALDLRKLGLLSRKLGRDDEALKFFQRAYSVSVGGADKAGARQASAMIKKLKNE